MKTFFKMAMCGAATYLGYFVAKGCIDTLRDPYERAKVKTKFQNIKKTIFEKSE